MVASERRMNYARVSKWDNMFNIKQKGNVWLKCINVNISNNMLI